MKDTRKYRGAIAECSEDDIFKIVAKRMRVTYKF